MTKNSRWRECFDAANKRNEIADFLYLGTEYYEYYELRTLLRRKQRLRGMLTLNAVVQTRMLYTLYKRNITFLYD